MYDIKEDLLKRLLTLSEQICLLEDKLTDLSAKDLEDSQIFKNNIIKLNELLNKESVIINTLSLEKINKFQKILLSNDKHDDTEVAFNRLFQLIQDKLDERDNNLLFNQKDDNDELNEEDTYEDIDNEDDLDIELESKDNSNEDIITDDTKDEIAIIDDYYMDSFELDKYLMHVIDRISIIVIKKMYQRINNTKDDTKAETKYKKQLLKYLKEFKYYIFTLDYKLERLGATYSFNIDSLPDIPEIDKDLSSLYHNQCINILDNLYSSDITIRKKADILRLLYDLMCLEEYINYLNTESLNKLLSFCEKLETITKEQTFGTYGKQKIKQRLGN